MEFFIRKNSTLPIIKVQIVKDGRVDFREFDNLTKDSTITFSMWKEDTNVYYIVNKPAHVMVKPSTIDSEEVEYYVYYQLTSHETRHIGGYIGEFKIKNSQGEIILPRRKKLYINITDSISRPDLCCKPYGGGTSGGGGGIPPTPSNTSIPPTPSPSSVTPTPTPTISQTPNYSLTCDLNCEFTNSGDTPVGLFTFNSTGENLSEFTYNSETLKDIYDNNYESFEMAIPNWDGTMEIMRLEKTQYSNSEITLSSQGETSTIESVNPILRTYRIKDGNKSIGSLGISETTVYCLYEKNGTTVLLTETTDRLYTAFKAFIDGPDFNCGNTVNPKEREINQFREAVISQSFSGAQYCCIDMIYDLPFNSYNRIQQNGGSSQLYIESMNLFLNAFYEPSFNGDFTFKVKGIVEWMSSTSEPWNIAGNPGYTQYRDTVGTYYKNNHNSVLPGVDYNFVYQINRSSFNNTGLQGISNFLGIYYPDIDNTINNVAVAYNVNVDLPYVMSGVTGNLFDNFLHAHEVGHAVLGFHTWNFGNYTVPLGPFSGTFIPDCANGNNTGPVCQTSNSDCHTIMSYCANQGTSFINLEFRPERITDGYTYASTYGQHLMCQDIPEEPYCELSIESNMTSPSFTFTVQFRDCVGGPWETYGTDFTYNDFPLYILVSDLPSGSSECYEYKVTSNDVSVECYGSNVPEVTPTPTPTIGNTPSVTPTNTITPSITAQVTQTPTVTQTVTITNTPSGTIGVSTTPTQTPTSTPTQTPTVTPTITQTNTPTNTITPSITTQVTQTPTISPTNTPTVTPTLTTTITPTISPTNTPTITPTLTTTITPTVTPTITPTKTLQPTVTPTVTPSSTPPQELCIPYNWMGANAIPAGNGIAYSNNINPSQITEFYLYDILCTGYDVNNIFPLPTGNSLEVKLGNQTATYTVNSFTNAPVGTYWTVGVTYVSGTVSTSTINCHSPNLFCFDVTQPGISPLPTSTNTPTPTKTPRVTPTMTVSPTLSVTPTNTPTKTAETTPDPTLTPTPSPVLWAPNTTLSPVAWIDAGDTNSYNTSGSELTSVTDKSGTYTMDIGGTPTVITNGLNSLNVFSFNGNNEYLQSSTFEQQVSSGNHWAIGIFRYDGTDSTQDSFWSYETNQSPKRDYAISAGASNNTWPGELDLDALSANRISTTIGNKLDWTGLGGLNRTQWYIVACYFNKTGNQIGIRIDGRTNTFSPVNDYDNSVSTNQELRLMRNRSSQELNGRVGEFIAYADIPGTSGTDLTQLEKAEGYLAWKWGRTVALPSDHPYKNSPPTA